MAERGLNDDTIDPDHLLFAAQTMATSMAVLAKRMKFSQRQARIVSAMAARLLQLTDDGIDASIQEKADQFLAHAGVRW